MSNFILPVTVGYWSIRGLGAPLHMLVMYSGTPLKAVLNDAHEKEGGGFEYSEWTSRKPDLKLINPLMNLPYVIDGDMVISQSNACLSYLGRKFGLWGVCPESISECEQLLAEVMDLRNTMVKFAYGPSTSENAPGVMKDVTGQRGSLHKFELWLERAVTGRGQSGTFLVCDHATAPDFHLWQMLDQFCGMARYYELPSPLENFPRLAFYYSSFGALPGNSRYFDCKLSKLPYNNKMAGFGATPSGAPWIPGQEYEWKDLSGIY